MFCDLFFPTAVWNDTLSINTENLINFTEEKKSSSEGRILSNINGWQSEDFLPEDDYRLHELCREIYIRSLKILEEFKYNTSELNLRFLNMWLNINYKNASNRVHIHSNSVLSGVYYLKCSKDCGNLIFPRNYSESFILKSIGDVYEDNTLNHTAISYTPEINKLLIFPSWIPHEVEKNNSEEERISISFNLGLTLK